MNELRRQLQRHDPVLHEQELSAADVARMRRMVLETVAPPEVRWSGALVTLTCGLSLLVGGAVWAARTMTGPAALSVGPLSDRTFDLSQVERRQVQFSTPGGTRVIWVLESTSN
jgi:hypothetical protein